MCVCVCIGLFHQAIPMSGSELSLWAVNVPESHPENYTKSVAEQLGCPTDDNWLMMDCLREVSARKLGGTRFNCTVSEYYIAPRTDVI